MILKSSDIGSIKKTELGYDIVMKRSSNGFRYYTTDWKNVPRYDKDGNQISPDEFRRQVIDKYGEIYFKQNYECSFLGSSDTLLSSQVLHDLHDDEPIEIRDNMLNIFKYPEKNHKYILTVDPAKDGKDSFAIQVVDVTIIKFEQVASAKLQVDYLMMPEYLNDYGIYYNTAFMIIENNEGAGQSIADILKNDYDYDNLYYDKIHVPNSITVKPKKFAGFTTNKKTRRLILNSMKTFFENDKFKIHDVNTIKEFFTFININGKYQADSECHDDMVMSLALTFAPFTEARNFVDIKKMIDAIGSDNDVDTDDINDYIEMGNFDDYTDEYIENNGYVDVF